jgi:hypothetical protein
MGLVYAFVQFSEILVFTVLLKLIKFIFQIVLVFFFFL